MTMARRRQLTPLKQRAATAVRRRGQLIVPKVGYTATPPDPPPEFTHTMTVGTDGISQWGWNINVGYGNVVPVDLCLDLECWEMGRFYFTNDADQMAYIRGGTAATMPPEWLSCTVSSPEIALLPITVPKYTSGIFRLRFSALAAQYCDALEAAGVGAEIHWTMTPNLT